MLTINHRCCPMFKSLLNNHINKLIYINYKIINTTKCTKQFRQCDNFKMMTRYKNSTKGDSFTQMKTIKLNLVPMKTIIMCSYKTIEEHCTAISLKFTKF